MAIMIDTLISGTAALITVLAAGVAFGAVGAEIASACSLLVWFIGYHVVFEVFGGGRTVGKRAARIRVVTDGGGPVGLRASLIRNLIRLLEGLAFLYLPAIVTVLASQNNQRIGDHAAGTLVIRETPTPAPRFGPPPEAQIPRAQYASWDATAVGDAEIAAVRSFLERRWGFEPAARRALAGELASRLRPQVAGVRPGLHDEAFLELLAAAKFRPHGGSQSPDG